MSIIIRAATIDDQDEIVTRERLKPLGLRWPNFVVADAAGELIGAAQIRKHNDGSRELGSLVVVPQRRGQGVAWRMVEALLAGGRGPVFSITRQARVPTFARWQFEPVETAQAPAAIKRNYYAGQIGGGLVTLLKGRAPSRLAILVRPSPRAPADAAGFLQGSSNSAHVIPERAARVSSMTQNTKA